MILIDMVHWGHSQQYEIEIEAKIWNQNQRDTSENGFLNTKCHNYFNWILGMKWGLDQKNFEIEG